MPERPISGAKRCFGIQPALTITAGGARQLLERLAVLERRQLVVRVGLPG